MGGFVLARPVVMIVFGSQVRKLGRARSNSYFLFSLYDIK